MLLRIVSAVILLPNAVNGLCTVFQALDPLTFPTLSSQTSVITTDLTVSGTWTFISCASATVTRQDIIIIDGVQYTPGPRRFGPGNFGNFGTTLVLNTSPQTQIVLFRYTSVILNLALPTHTADISWTFSGTGADYPVSGVCTTAFSIGPVNQVAITTTPATNASPTGPSITQSPSTTNGASASLTDSVPNTSTPNTQTIILTSITLISTTLHPSRTKTRSWSQTPDPPTPSQPTGLSEGIIGVIAGIAGFVVLAAFMISAFFLYKLRTRRQNHPLNPLLQHPIEVEMEDRMSKEVNSTTSLVRMGHVRRDRPTSASLRYPNAEVYSLNSGRLNTEARY